MFCKGCETLSLFLGNIIDWLFNCNHFVVEWTENVWEIREENVGYQKREREEMTEDWRNLLNEGLYRYHYDVRIK
jgi:hypothetical protein